MSRESNRHDRKKGRIHGRYWKLIDDNSGFVIYSDEAVIDHRGRLTIPKYKDPVHPTERPPNYYQKQPVLPIYRVPPSTDWFVDPGSLDDE